ncbi:hypothetical protein D3C87_1940640 [compost metagenome]
MEVGEIPQRRPSHNVCQHRIQTEDRNLDREEIAGRNKGSERHRDDGGRKAERHCLGVGNAELVPGRVEAAFHSVDQRFVDSDKLFHQFPAPSTIR